MNEGERILCWGGPKHGEVMSLPLDGWPLWRFPLPTPIAYMPGEETEPMAATRIASIEYHVGKFATPDPSEPGGFRIWQVLVYGENRERLQKHLEVFADLLLALCEPMAWSAFQ